MKTDIYLQRLLITNLWWGEAFHFGKNRQYVRASAAHLDLDLDLFIIHVGKIDIPLNNTKQRSSWIAKLEESIETNSGNVVISITDN